ncbi:MAG TPA: hypothetical protein VGM36_14410 [Rhizomicrobium sp.]|jgi:hypothetical protein
MNKLFKSGIVVLSLMGGAAAITGPASAAGIAIDFGNVAMGYSDGYWDSGHHWHHWDRSHARAYRTAHRDHYHGWRHDDRHHHGGWDH